MLVGVDCDGVLSDFFGSVVDFMRGHHDLHLDMRQATDWDVRRSFGLTEFQWRSYVMSVDLHGLCSRMKPIPGAREWLDALRRRHEVIVVTKPLTPGWLEQRADWLVSEMGVPLESQFHVGDKKYVWLDTLIDDKPDVSSYTGRVIVLAQPWNTNTSSLRLSYEEILRVLA